MTGEAMIKLKILNKDLTLEEGEALYTELHKLFGNNTLYRQPEITTRGLEND